jgi:hypothetical protein
MWLKLRAEKMMIEFSFALTSAFLVAGFPAGASLVGDTVTCSAVSPFALTCGPTTAVLDAGP